MNTPVSFELAKLLKEKGFNEPCIQQYYYDGKLLFCVDVAGMPVLKTNNESYLDSGGDCISSPTIAEVVMWLYEEYGVWIACHRYNGKLPFGCIISDNTGDVDVKGGYPNPTQAYKAAIEHCLTKI